jgi:hypothetical protein
MKPKKWKPERGEKYFFPVFNDDRLFNIYIWENDEYDKSLYNNGVICKTEAETIKLAKSMMEVAERRNKCIKK